jgi:hypothetical protein
MSLSGLENQYYGHRDPPHYATPLLSAKVGTDFTDKSVSLLADSGHRVFLCALWSRYDPS